MNGLYDDATSELMHNANSATSTQLVAMFDITPNNFAQESPRAATMVDDMFADNSCAAVSRCVKYFIDEEIRCENLTYLFFCRHCIGGWLFDAVVILATVFAYFDVG